MASKLKRFAGYIALGLEVLGPADDAEAAQGSHVTDSLITLYSYVGAPSSGTYRYSRARPRNMCVPVLISLKIRLASPSVLTVSGSDPTTGPPCPAHRDPDGQGVAPR
jgi:hypothetical protein